MIGLFYRNSISATLSALPRTGDKASTVTSNSEKGGGGSGTEECSIGSAGSLAKRNQHNTEALPWDDEDVESGESVKTSTAEIICITLIKLLLIHFCSIFILLMQIHVELFHEGNKFPSSAYIFP
jgi:hypothetical protein